MWFFGAKPTTGAPTSLGSTTTPAAGKLYF